MKKHTPLLLILTVHIFLLLNLRFEAWPEMLVYPYLLNHGFKLYQDIINPYLPLFTGFLGLYFSIVATTVFNLKLLTWVIIIISDLLIYFITLKRYSVVSATAALGFFVVFQPLLDGNGLWYDLALVPILLLAFYFQSPLLVTIGFFVKQSVVWLFLIFIKSFRKLLYIFTLLFLVVLVPFTISGTIKDYLFWSWQFPFTIFPFMPGHKDWGWGSPGLWIMALAPFLSVLLLLLLSKQKVKQIFSKHHPISWMILSFSFILPRFGLFHLQPALAFAALSIGKLLPQISIAKLNKKPAIKLLLTFYLLILAVFWQRQIKLFWRRETRFFETEIIAAAKSLKHKTATDTPILFLNAPDQLMVLAERIPTKPWAITFPWYLELPEVQGRFSTALNQGVETVVFSPYQNQGKFIPGSYIPQEINQKVEQEFTTTESLSDNIMIKTRN